MAALVVGNDGGSNLMLCKLIGDERAAIGSIGRG
jgi:hypothetical protein